MGNSMQTLLALIGAVAFQSSNRSSDPELDSQIATQMKVILGDDFDRRFQAAKQPGIAQTEGTEDAIAQSVMPKAGSFKVQYRLPSTSRAKQTDRHPCATLYYGDQVSLEPVISGYLGDTALLMWSVSPRLPISMGLEFDTNTGELSVSTEAATTPLTSSGVMQGRVGGNHSGRDAGRSMIMHPTTFVVTARAPERGTARCYLTLRVAPRAVSENPAAFAGDEVQEREIEHLANNLAKQGRTVGSSLEMRVQQLPPPSPPSQGPPIDRLTTGDVAGWASVRSELK